MPSDKSEQRAQDNQQDELGWPFGRNRYPYLVGKMRFIGFWVNGYEGGDANVHAWTGGAKQPMRYVFDEDGSVDRPPVDVGAEIREDLL